VVGHLVLCILLWGGGGGRGGDKGYASAIVLLFIRNA